MFGDFKMTYVLNLDSRKDRWAHIHDNVLKKANIKPFKRVSAIKHSDGGRGCYLSHVKILDEIIKDDVDMPLVLEDDAQFYPEWRQILADALKQLPANWEILYLGYNLDPHGFVPGPNHPRKISNNILRIRWCLTTHAYAIRNSKTAAKMKALIDTPSVQECVGKGNTFPSIDVVYAKLVTNKLFTYAVYPMLFKQMGSKSDIINIFTNFPLRQNVDAVLKICGEI